MKQRGMGTQTLSLELSCSAPPSRGTQRVSSEGPGPPASPSREGSSRQVGAQRKDGGLLNGPLEKGGRELQAEKSTKCKSGEGQ